MLPGALCLLLFCGACQFIDKAKIQQRIESRPVYMNMIYLFDQYEASIRIDAPVAKVWATFTDPHKMVRILSSFDTLVFSPDAGATLAEGTHFGYTTRVAGESLQGTGVVTSVVPERYLSMALLEPQKDVNTVVLEPQGEGRTRVWIHMTVEALPRNMAVTGNDIRRSINAHLRRTLKNLKEYSEGREPPEEPSEGARVLFRAEGLEPFQILEYRHVFSVDMNTISRYFLKEDAYVRLLEQVGLRISPHLVHMLAMPGVGVPYTARIGPVPLSGIILVTEAVPSQALNLTAFHSNATPIRGGSNIRFFATGDAGTEMQLIEFYRVPETYECHPVDRGEVKAILEERVAELAHLTEWIAEQRPPRALME